MDLVRTISFFALVTTTVALKGEKGEKGETGDLGQLGTPGEDCNSPNVWRKKMSINQKKIFICWKNWPAIILMSRADGMEFRSSQCLPLSATCACCRERTKAQINAETN